MSDALFPCVDCGREISKRASICPGCGAPNEPALIDSDIGVHSGAQVNDIAEEFIFQSEKWASDLAKGIKVLVSLTVIGAAGIWLFSGFWELGFIFAVLSGLLAWTGIWAKTATKPVLSNLAGLVCASFWGWITWYLFSNYTEWADWAVWCSVGAIALVAYGTIGGEMPPELSPPSE